MTRSATVPVDVNAPAEATNAQKGKVKKKKSMKRGESSTSPRRIAAVTGKHLRALEYRRMGYTYAQMAEKFGYSSAQGAHKAVRSVLKRVIREPAQNVILLELERVDALFVRPYQDALAGNLMALSACLAIMSEQKRASAASL